MIIPPACLPDKVVGDDTVYSSLFSPVIQVDGACYSNPQIVEAMSEEDASLMVYSGTLHPDCARVACGPVGLYCYETVGIPVGSVLVLMPLHFPIPVIAMPNNSGRCYHKPGFIKQVFEDAGTVANDQTNEIFYGSYALPVESNLCGVTYLYSACNGNSTLIVANESSDTVFYGGQCWTNPQVVFDVGTRVVVAGTYVTAVSGGCLDVLCTGSNADGPSVMYTDVETGNEVNVQFPNLDSGIPYYGVAAEKLDTGYNGLISGQATVQFSGATTSQVVIASVPGSGRLAFYVYLKGHSKNLVIVRGTTTLTYAVGQNSSTAVVLDVQEGDRVSVELRIKGSVCGSVKWNPAPVSFRKYDEAVLSFGGSATVKAVSFCGMVARTPYVFYGTLPASAASTYPNPDTYLTVQGVESSEYVLVTSYTTGDKVPQGLNNTVSYAGQPLTGPLTFRFYTGRSSAGAHGEMDVWLGEGGRFPLYLASGRYTLFSNLEPAVSIARLSAQVGDTKRTALNAVSNTEGIYLPSVFVSNNGDKITVSGRGSSSVVTLNGTTYNKAEVAPGLAYSVIEASQVIAPDVFEYTPASAVISWQDTSYNSHSGDLAYFRANSTPDGVDSVDMSGASIVSVQNLSTLTSLTSFNCSDNVSLTTLDVSGCADLQYIDCSVCNIASLDLRGCADLQYIDCSSNMLTSVNVTGLTQLEWLECYYNDSLTSLDVSTCTGLLHLNCSQNAALSSLNVLGCSSLVWVAVNTCLLSADEVSTVLCSLNTNGLSAGIVYIYDNNPPTPTGVICADATTGLQSKSWTVDMDDQVPPPAPSGVTSTWMLVDLAFNAIASWMSNSLYESGFNVEYRTSILDPWATFGSGFVGPGVTSMMVQVSPATYFFRVRAYNDAGGSAWAYS